MMIGISVQRKSQWPSQRIASNPESTGWQPTVLPLKPTGFPVELCGNQPSKMLRSYKAACSFLIYSQTKSQAFHLNTLISIKRLFSVRLGVSCWIEAGTKTTHFAFARLRSMPIQVRHKFNFMYHTWFQSSWVKCLEGSLETKNIYWLLNTEGTDGWEVHITFTQASA